MKEIEVSGFDNLSNLGRDLKKVENAYIKTASSELAQARNSVVGALPGFKLNRLNFGRLLRAYKEHFKAGHGWVEAAKIIASALDCSERTVYRIIEDYERASQLPSITLNTMLEQKIDPAAAKNAPMVDNLVRMPSPATREEAATIVSQVRKDQFARKRAAKKAAAKPAEAGLEAFTEHIVRQFEHHFRSMPPEQRDSAVRYVLEMITSTLRSDISELHQYSRPALVPKPNAAVAA